MIPQKSLVQPPIPSAFLPPDANLITDLTDYELGGVALYDSTQGLQVQVWYMEVLGSAAETYVQVSAPNTAPVTLISLPNITWARLAFDQNMYPVICYVDQTGPGFWWYDPTIPGHTFTNLTSDVITPCCSMDDKRPLETRLGTNDVIIAYIRTHDLFYRQQRDRYAVEYPLYVNIDKIIPNPSVHKIGMGEGNRFQFQINGSIYQ